MTKISFAIGVVAAAFGILPAGAADLGRLPPAQPFYAPPPMVRVYNWTGCYLGGQLGGAFADNKTTGEFAGFLADVNNSASAATIGGQVGCDLQFARNWVIGAQIDGAWTNLVGSEALTGSAAIPGASVGLSGNLNSKANVIATGTGRIGYATNFDSIAGLFYVKGGAAFVKLDSPSFAGQATLTGGGTSRSGAFDFSASSSSRWGWTVGLGTEWAVLGNWSVFGEWDYMNFGSHTTTFTDATFGSTQVTIKQQINELKLGINYRFGNPLPGQYP